jgi:hypothetical protein
VSRRLPVLALAVAGALLVPAAAATPRDPTPGAAAAMFKAWDRNADGSLSPAEFAAGWQQAQRSAELQARLRQQFAAVDADRSGAIEAAEYAGLALVKKAGAAAPPFSRFDADASGGLKFGEYLALVQALAPAERGQGGR